MSIFFIFCFLFSFLLSSIGHAISTKSIVFFCESSNNRSGLPSLQFIPVLIYSHYNILPLLSIIFPFPWFSVYHFVPSGCRELSIAHFSGNTFSELSYRLLYSVPAIFLLLASRCWTVSLTCRVSLYCSSSNKPLFFFHGLVSIICSCNVYINAVILGFVLHLGCPY